MPNKSYLGDSVYAEIDEYGVLKLTTEDGLSVSNSIYLEPEVYEQLIGYVDRIKSEKEYKCLDCGVKLTYNKASGVIMNAWSRKSIDRSHLGFVCDACHNKREE
jgi:DNA-directed RNA polymerase subunit RPC12/RpoP